MRISLSFLFKLLLVVVTSTFILFGLFKIIKRINQNKAQRKIQVFIGNETHVHPFPDHGERIVTEYMEIGEILPNCGLDEICPEEHFPVHIYTGKSNNDMPKICISGKYVIQKDINHGGRGLNMVIVDTHRMQAVNAKRFDTYSMDSGELEVFLTREVKKGDILVGVTFDEASKNLGNMAKSFLADLGSSEIQNLQFRDQWIMVTQNGLRGGAFTPYEFLQKSSAGVWTPIERKFCIPRQIEGRVVIPDPPVHQNEARASFCAKHGYIKEFCAADQKNSLLKPAALTVRQYLGNPTFTSPIIVIAGQSIASLSLTLETLISQPGIQTKYVSVVYNPTVIRDVEQLTSLFGFGAVATQVTDYWKLMEVVFSTGYKRHPDSPYIIVIQEGLMLAPDFLLYMATLQPLLQDSTLMAIAAWNPNGYINSSSRADLAYRSSDFPGLGFMIRLETYVKELKHNMKTCCSKRPWEGNWLESERWERSIIIPDLSRVLRRPVGPELNKKVPLVKALFHRVRATNLDADAMIKNVDTLRHAEYFNFIKNTLLSREKSIMIPLQAQQIEKCYNLGSPAQLKLSLNKSKVNVISFKDIGGGMKKLAKCFGLFFERNSTHRGEDHGILRFSSQESEVMLLSNNSPHFKISPYNTTKLELAFL